MVGGVFVGRLPAFGRRRVGVRSVVGRWLVVCWLRSEQSAVAGGGCAQRFGGSSSSSSSSSSCCCCLCRCCVVCCAASLWRWCWRLVGCIVGVGWWCVWCSIVVIVGVVVVGCVVVVVCGVCGCALLYVERCGRCGHWVWRRCVVLCGVGRLCV